MPRAGLQTQTRLFVAGAAWPWGRPEPAGCSIAPQRRSATFAQLGPISSYKTKKASIMAKKNVRLSREHLAD